jgi:drug/metabolite transporter (DMT)-like permease
MIIAGGRSILAAGVMLGLRFILKKRKPPPEKTTFTDTLKTASFGFFYAATMILFVIANKLTSSANAILLQYTAPAWTAIMGWLVLRERLRRDHWVTLALVTTGMFLVFSNGLTLGSVLGDVIALLSGIAFAANSVVLRLKKDGNPEDILIYSHIICALFSIPFFFLHPPPITTGNIMSILFMGIFQIGVASVLFAYGIKRISAIQVMLTAAIEPVLNPLWVFLVTGVKPSLMVVIGGCIIIMAISFSAVVQSKTPRHESKTPLKEKSAEHQQS